MTKNIKDLLPDEQKWLAKAVDSIIMIDVSVKKTHAIFIKQLFMIFLEKEPSRFLKSSFHRLQGVLWPTVAVSPLTDG